MPHPPPAPPAGAPGAAGWGQAGGRRRTRPAASAAGRQSPGTYGYTPGVAAQQGQPAPQVGTPQMVTPVMRGREPHTVPLDQRPNLRGTRVDMLDSARAIGTQIAALAKGFLPFDQVSHDTQQLRVDYERLRITLGAHARHRPRARSDKLLEKILLALFKFVNADRGVIFLTRDRRRRCSRGRRGAATAPTRRSRSARPS